VANQDGARVTDYEDIPFEGMTAEDVSKQKELQKLSGGRKSPISSNGPIPKEIRDFIA